VVAHAHSATLLGALAGATGSGYEAQTFSDAVLVNNVVRNNRSFFNDATLNGGAGGLAPNPTMPVWDLQVVGAAPTDQLTPQNCLLTNLTDASGDYSAPGDANLAADPSFVSGYENLLRTATVLDEGGNAITVRFTPLLPTTADYHLNPNSPAIDAGQDGGLTEDIDGDARPTGLGHDIGADEYVAGVFTALQVLTPNGGERIPSGSTYTITWGAPAGADHYTVEDSSNGGTTWRTLETDVTDTFLAWVVPTPGNNRTDHLIRVRAFDVGGAPLGRDTSDKPFTVEVVRLLSPNGAEVFIGGGMATVSWLTNGTSAPATSTVIERSFDGGANWHTITTVPGNPGSYQWAVPSPANVRDSVLIRVTLYAGTTDVGSDRSDGTFFIRPALVP
jgi:hypothetical protein